VRKRVIRSSRKRQRATHRGPDPGRCWNSQCKRIHIFTINSATPISRKRSALLGVVVRARTAPSVGSRSLWQSADGSVDGSVPRAADMQTDIHQPADLALARSAPLIGAPDRYGHAQTALLGTLQGMGRPIACASATQLARTSLPATNSHGDNRPHMAAHQVTQHWTAAKALIGIQAVDPDARAFQRSEQFGQDSDCVHGGLDKHHGHGQGQIRQQDRGSGTAVKTGGAGACFAPTDLRVRILQRFVAIIGLISLRRST